MCFLVTCVKTESAAYAGDAAAVEQTQSQDALDLLDAVQSFAGGTSQGDWNLAPWVQQAVAQAQAQDILVNGAPGALSLERYHCRRALRLDPLGTFDQEPENPSATH